jgi:hypothetical protein
MPQRSNWLRLRGHAGLPRATLQIPRKSLERRRAGETHWAEPRPALARRLGRRTALTFPVFPPPQKN